MSKKGEMARRRAVGRFEKLLAEIPCCDDCAKKPGASPCGCGGDEIGGLTVGDDEIRSLDAKIRQLNADIMSSSVVKTSYKSDWSVFEIGWLKWASEHTTILSQSGDDVAADFNAYVAEYNRRLGDFIGRGGITKAVPHDPPPLQPEKPLDKIASGIERAGLAIGGGLLLYFLLTRKKR